MQKPPPAPKIPRFHPVSVKNQRFLPASTQEEAFFLRTAPSKQILSAQCAHWAPLPKGEARRRAVAHVGLPLHPPSSTAPKPSPLGGRWLAAGETDEGRQRKSYRQRQKSHVSTPHPSKIKGFCQLPPGGRLFYANFSEYKKSGGLPNFGNPPDLLIDKTPSAWQTGADCAGFCPG